MELVFHGQSQYLVAFLKQLRARLCLGKTNTVIQLDLESHSEKGLLKPPKHSRASLVQAKRLL